MKIRHNIYFVLLLAVMVLGLPNVVNAIEDTVEDTTVEESIVSNDSEKFDDNEITDEETIDEEIVEDTTEEDETVYVAKIGDVMYETLDEAIKSAENGSTIVLLSDASISVGTISKDITIIGNGHVITVDKQPNTDDGRLNIYASLTFDNTIVNHENPSNWSIVMNSNGKLNLVNNTEYNLKSHGVYTSPNAEINLNNSKLSATEMKYTAFMAEVYATLNVKNGSSFVINNSYTVTANGNGITGFNINVDDSKLLIINCDMQGIVHGSLILTNHAIAEINNNYVAINIYSKDKIVVNDGTTLITNNNSSRAIMTQGNGSIYVRRGGTLEAKYNGEAWTKEDDEAKYYAQKGTITLGVYGWYSSYGKVLTYTSGELMFEDGATVNVTDNYVRGLTLYGTAYIGNTTVIMNNGGERVATGGGIYNAGGTKTTIASGAAIYNNHANKEADDIYNANGSEIVLPSTLSDWSLNGGNKHDNQKDCTDKINGWYEDGGDIVDSVTGEITKTRWNAHDDTEETDYYDEVYSGTFNNQLSIKAAHDKAKVIVHYINTRGEKLTDDVTIIGSNKLEYVSEEKTFAGYELIEVPYNSTGIMTRDNDIHVYYVYTDEIGDEGEMVPPHTGVSEVAVNTSDVTLYFENKKSFKKVNF